MSSINQLVSELAHSLQQPNSVPVRRALKLGIIHARNTIIRKSDSNNRFTDKVLQQKFRVTLIDVPDGDLAIEEDSSLCNAKRTANKVPRPVRLTNNLPFHSVRTAGTLYNRVIAFVKESVMHFYSHLPGMRNVATYDYINEYIYIKADRDQFLNQLEEIIIESVFEYPHMISTETHEGVVSIDDIDDDDEFLLPEDMIPDIKKVVLETFVPEVVRETNEIPNTNLTK